MAWRIEGAESYDMEGSDIGYLTGWAEGIMNGVHVMNIETLKGGVKLMNFQPPSEHGDAIRNEFTINLYDSQVKYPIASGSVHFSVIRQKESLLCREKPSACTSYHDLVRFDIPHGMSWKDRVGTWTEGRAAAGLQGFTDIHKLPRRRIHEPTMSQSSNGHKDSFPDFSNFVRCEGEEVVLMDEMGPGCITRLFLPLVDTASANKWRLRVRIDTKMVIDEELGLLSSLSIPPFLHPIAGFGGFTDDTWFLSMVPMVFHSRIVISLLPFQQQVSF